MPCTRSLNLLSKAQPAHSPLRRSAALEYGLRAHPDAIPFALAPAEVDDRCDESRCLTATSGCLRPVHRGPVTPEHPLQRPLKRLALIRRHGLPFFPLAAPVPPGPGRGSHRTAGGTRPAAPARAHSRGMGAGEGGGGHRVPQHHDDPGRYRHRQRESTPPCPKTML